MLRDRCLDYLLGDRLLATVLLAPTGNVDGARSEQTIRIRFKDVLTGRRLVAVANEAKMACLRRSIAAGDSEPAGLDLTFDDFKAALDREARSVQSLLRRAEDLPEHAPGRINREMVGRIKKIDLVPIG